MLCEIFRFQYKVYTVKPLCKRNLALRCTYVSLCILASQTLTQGERVWSNCYSRVVAQNSTVRLFAGRAQVSVSKLAASVLFARTLYIPATRSLEGFADKPYPLRTHLAPPEVMSVYVIAAIAVPQLYYII